MEPVRARIAVPEAALAPPRLRAARRRSATSRRPSTDVHPSYGFDIDENDGAYVVSAAVPGLAPDDIKVELEGRALTISGEAKADEEGGDGYRRRSFGSLHRSLRLPEGVDPDSITASCENGVLTVTIPKPEAARARAIEVKAA